VKAFISGKAQGMQPANGSATIALPRGNINLPEKPSCTEARAPLA